MNAEKDYEDLLKLFNKNKVRYAIVGAHAVGLYAEPRYTKDLDILIEPSAQNAQRVLKALRQFGFGSVGLSEKDFTQKGKVIQLGYEPIRVDLLTSIEGVSFKEVWRGRKMDLYGKQKAVYIGKRQLARNKRIVGRKQDQADLELLG